MFFTCRVVLTSAAVLLFGIAAAAADAPLRVQFSTTYGILGPRRPPQIVAGENCNVTIIAQGVQQDSEGDCKITLDFTFDGPVCRRRERKDLTAWLTLGGAELEFNYVLDYGQDLPPGEYTVTLHLKDELSGQSATDDLTLVVLPKSTFSAVNIEILPHPTGRSPPNNFFGCKVYLTSGLNGCVARKDGQALATCVLDVIDRTSGRIETSLSKDVLGATQSVPYHLYWMSGNRACSN